VLYRVHCQVWLRYADVCADAEDVFAYLKVNRIGLEHAVLYTSWARVAEAKGKYAFAKQILSYAVGKRVKPIDALRAALAALTVRTAGRADNPTAAPAAAANEPAAVRGLGPNPAVLLDIARESRKPLAMIAGNADRRPLHLNTAQYARALSTRSEEQSPACRMRWS
jgi:hypothetical protein